MKIRTAGCLLLLSLFMTASVTFAKPSTRPTATSAAKPTTGPATREAAAAATKPAEVASAIHDLAKKIRQISEDEEKLPKVAYFDLSRPLIEKAPDFSLFGDADALTLRALLQRL